MTKKEQEFLESFKAGEYVLIQLMVKTKNSDKLMEVLKEANIDLVVLPAAKTEMDFYSNKGETH